MFSKLLVIAADMLSNACEKHAGRNIGCVVKIIFESYTEKKFHSSVQHRAVPAYFHLWFPLLKRFHPEFIKRISCPNTKQKLRGVLFYLTVREKEILTLQYNTGLSSLHFQGVQYCLRWNRSEFYIWEVWRRNSVKNMFAMIAGKQFESLLSGFATVKFLFLKLFSLVSNIFIIFA